MIELAQRLPHRILAGRVEPRSLEGFAAERVLPLPNKAVPVADRESKLVAHRLTHYDALRIVPSEGERVV